MWRSILLLTVLFIPVSALSSRAAENSLTARKAMPRKSGFARFRTISFSSGIGSLTSGLCQPIAAWLSDRLNSRIFAALGLALAAACLSSAADSVVVCASA